MSSEKIKAQDARDVYVLKQKAMQYYAENGVPQRMEEILNSTFYDCPNDVYGHIANFFEQFKTTPTITKVLAREVYDSNGRKCPKIEMFGMIKNFERTLATAAGISQAFKVDPYTLKPEEKQHLEEERHKFLTDVINMLKHSVNDALCGLDPTQQSTADSKLTDLINKLRAEEEEKAAEEKEQTPEEEIVTPKSESVSPTKGKKSPKGKAGGKGGKEVVVIPDETPEISICGCTALPVASQAVCEAAAFVKQTPVYQHIASLKFDQIPSALRLPLPLATILSSGKCMPGKQNYVTEYMVVPKPDMPYHQAYEYINKIYHHCAQSISAKTGAVTRNVNELGALCPTFDRPEQGLDLLQEAITALGLTPAEDFNIVLNLAGPEIFDYEKGKYEVMVGTQKSAEDLADYWGDICGRYPSLIAIIDPMRRVEKEAWMKLCERVTSQCHVIGDVTHHRAGCLVEEEMTPEWQTSGAVLRMREQNTVSEVMQAADKMTEAGCQVIVGACSGTSCSTFPVDLAIGLQARFIKLGAPVRGENVAMYNYMLHVEEALKLAGSLTCWEPHVFSLIKPPTPPPEEEPEGEDGAGSPSRDKKN